MKLINTKISGPKLIKTEIYKDKRGFLKEVYKQILTRFPDMKMDGDWKVAPNNFVHAIQEMPVSFTPEK